MDWVSVVPHHKGYSLASHSSFFCLQKPLQFVLVLFSSWVQQRLVQLFMSSTTAEELLAIHWALPCSVHDRAELVLSCCCVQKEAEPLISAKKRDGQHGEASPELGLVSHGHGVFLPLAWHQPWLCKKKREVLRHRQLCWAGEEGQGDWGAWLCLESAHTEVHQLQVSVIAKTKQEQPENQRDGRTSCWGEKGLSEVLIQCPCVLCCCVMCEHSATLLPVRNEKFQGLLSTLWIFTVAQRKVI